MKKATVAIIGGGPAGVAATIYLKRALVDVILIEKGAPGGKINFTAEIQNYPGFEIINGPDLAFKLFEQVSAFDVPFTYGDVEKVIPLENSFLIKTDDGDIEAEFVIYATGTKERELNVPGEQKYNGRGVSFCAVCDGPFYKGETVVVVGGGNSAFQEALYLAGFAKEVYLIHRSQNFRADPVMVEKAYHTSNIHIILDSEVIEVLGDEQIMTGVEVNNRVTKEKQVIKAKALFPYIGQLPMTDPLRDLDVLDERGYIKVDANMETSVRNLFGAGDVTAKGLRQIVTATNDGAIAAIEISHRVA